MPRTPAQHTAHKVEQLQRTLDFIRAYRRGMNGMSPTLEQIAVAIYGEGSTSKRSAQVNLVQPLIDGGYLCKHGRYTGLVPTGKRIVKAKDIVKVSS